MDDPKQLEEHDTTDKDVPVVLKFKVPILRNLASESLPSKKNYFNDCIEFKKMSLDPNLGMLKELPNENIPYQINTLNKWNIQPYLMKFLPSKVEVERSILLFGGLNPKLVAEHNLENDIVLGSSIFQFKLDTKKLFYYGTMIEPRCYHCSTVVNQYMYITGGYSLLKRECGKMQAVSSTDRMDLINIQWKRCSNMIKARAEHTAVSYKKNLFVLGGKNAQEILSSVEFYDTEEDLWTHVSFLPQPTTGLCAALYMHKIWIFGGVISVSSNRASTALTPNVFSYDPTSNRWEQESSLPHPCAYSACVTNGQSVWLIGGCTLSESSKQSSLASCSAILRMSLFKEPGKWVSVASLWHPRHALVAVLHDDVIYALGGVESSIYSASDVVECLNIGKNMVTEKAKLPLCIAGSGAIFVSENIRNFFDLSKYIESDENITHGVDECLDVADIMHEMCPHSKSKIHTRHSFDSLSDFSNYLNDPELSVKENKIYIPSFNNKRAQKDLKLEKEKYQDQASMEVYLRSVEKKSSVLQRKWLEYYGSPQSDFHVQSKLSPSCKSFSADSFLCQDKIDRLLSDFDEFSISSSKKLPECKLNLLQHSDSVLSLNSTALSGHYQSSLYVKSNKEPDVLRETKIADSSAENFAKNDILKEDKLLDMEGIANKILLSTDAFQTILIAGGEDLSDRTKGQYLLAYDCKKNQWQYAGYLPDFFAFHAAVYMSNKFYIVGGFKSESPSGNFQKITGKTCCYDFSLQKWLDKCNLCIPRACHSAIVVDNKIFVFGGRDRKGQILASVEAYDESTDSWIECKPIPFPVYGTAVAYLSGVIHLYGGIIMCDGNEIISSKLAFYNPHRNSWCIGPNLSPPLAFCGISTHVDSIWLFGGLTDNGKIVSSKDIFIVTKKGLKKQYELSVPRHCSVTVSQDSKVYIIGGENMSTEEEVDTCEVFDMAKNEIYLVSPLPVKASGKAGAVISNIRY